MLLRTKQLNGFYLIARDGALGTVEDVYFDDEKWTIRHLVVDTGDWLPGRRVLISPVAVTLIDRIDRSMHVNLRKQQVESSPDIDTDKPVSRQHEKAFHDHYGFPYYWTGPTTWGATVYPAVVEMAASDKADPAKEAKRDAQDMARADPHLRSAKEVVGYAIQATDGALGHVEDFLFSEEDWRIRAIVVDPRNWWPGKHVVIPVRRIGRVDWAEQKVHVALTREQIRNGLDSDSTGLFSAPTEEASPRRPPRA